MAFAVLVVRDLSRLPDHLKRGAVSIGNFDGVHRGHASLVERLLLQARKVRGPAVAFTFDPHPVRLLRPESAPPPLTWVDRKASLLGELGVDAVVAYPTDLALLSLSPDEFFQSIVVDALQARALVEGPNFYFGRGRAGTIDVLRNLSSAASLELEIVAPAMLEGEIISSSRVRACLAAGNVDLAARLLTRPYRIRGMVTHGAGRGAKIGFPTANVDAIDTLLPGPGVYAGRGYVAGGTWPAAINIGPNPTFGDATLKVEAHLIGLESSVYGDPIEIDFLKRLRDIERFPTVDDLLRQLARDVEAARQAAALS